MNGFIIFFLLAVSLLFHGAWLPGGFLLAVIAILTVTAASRSHWWLAGLLFGALWGGLHGHRILQHTLPVHLQGTDLQIVGRISDLPVQKGRVTRFIVHVESVLLPMAGSADLQKLRLSWYDNHPVLKNGDRWRLTVRLKRNHGLMNPGGFDYEQWLLGRGISATGYVRGKSDNELLSRNSMPWYDRLRAELADRIDRAGLPEEAEALVRTLAIGQGAGLSAEQWQWFRLTGTSHLMVISGLHVSLAAGAGWWLAFLLQQRLRWLFAHAAGGIFRRENFNPELLPALCSWSIATGYAALAGFSVPTQRALIMLTVYLLFRVFRRHITLSQPFFIALFLVVLLDPLSVLSAGLWLSFGAVALIYHLISFNRFVDSRWRKWLLWHALLTLAMLPATALFFQYVSPLAYPANLLAVPFVSLLLVPLVLAGVVLLLVYEPAGLLLLLAVQWPGGWLLDFLEMLAAVETLQFYPSGQSLQMWPLLGLSMALLLLPRGTGLNWLALPLSAAFFLPAQESLEKGQFRLSIIDVGQGLSSLVETQNHRLLFDTGGRLSGSVSLADIAVLPYLRYQGVEALDKLIISHTDTDHAGGTDTVLQHLSTRSLVTASRFAAELQADEFCHSDLSWVWDGVTFSFLNAKQRNYGDKNNASCVLLVASGKSAVLLPGDIEREAETDLLNSGMEPVKLVVAPHHGSKTSSTEAFVRALDPDYVVYSAGFRNRFRFPHPAVVARYAEIGSDDFRTDRDGLLRFVFDSEGLTEPPYAYRKSRHRFWRNSIETSAQAKETLSRQMALQADQH